MPPTVQTLLLSWASPVSWEVSRKLVIQFSAQPHLPWAEQL